ncbi:PQQ-binding-like beta-propeller repeat protein [Streptomyces sp. NPDC050842]|uniref:outer membrane protein assembly factor BamB family protein n=1 Tax=Streptomyces sp. NPDC050842 TaxID=3365636 RepID=UPI0037B2DD49
MQTAARGNRGYARSGATVCYLDGRVLHGIDAGTGAKRWTAGSGLGDLEFLGSLRGLFLAAGDKGLCAFHAESGRQVWHHAAGGAGSASGAWSTHVVGDHLYATVRQAAPLLAAPGLTNVRPGRAGSATRP